MVKILIAAISLSVAIGCSSSQNFRGDGEVATKVEKENDSSDANKENEKTELSNAPIFVSKPVLIVKPGDPIGESVAFDLTKWSSVFLTSSSEYTHPDPNWILTSTTATQTVNSRPVVLLSEIDTPNQIIEGKFTTHVNGDDDFMGFVYGYESANKFYLFDWKKSPQNLGAVEGKAGMSVKLVDTSSTLSFADLWSSTGSPSKITTLYRNDTPWEFSTTYSFSLNFVPGATRIVIKGADGTVIDDIRISDSTIQNGKFGFYNFSQDNIVYEGFKRTPVQGSDYAYQVKATAASGKEISYSLKQAPNGMTIDSKTGMIKWSKSNYIKGDHTIVIVASTADGGIAEQKFVLNVP